jgi:hypothetical protein
MKRLWLVLLSLGLVLAFSASAMAVDVKFSGSFYAAGMYLDKTSFNKDSYTISSTSTQNPGISTAFYYQRLRVQTDFIVSPGLKLVTRFDAMERIWGGQRSDPTSTTLATDSAGTRSENENIAFDWAYLEYDSPIGLFQVGEMEDGRTGTVFGDSYTTAGRIKYAYTIGPATIKADITKVKDQSNSAVTSTTATDADNDKYGLEGVYSWKDGKAGMKVTYYNYAEKSPGSSPSGNYKKQYFLFTPYAIAKIGPVALQAEFNYATGNLKNYGDSTPDVSLQNISAFFDATATFAPVYFGGTFAYISGDNPDTKDKQEGGTLTGGIDWNPCLIMFNQDLAYWVGTLQGYYSTSNASGMGAIGSSATAPGAWFGQGRVGVNPLAALDIMASLSYAKADQKPANVLNDLYGWEIDVTGTYKITNNLSYMLGVGYWFVGDYYKGTSNANRINDDYMLINKLTLTF